MPSLQVALPMTLDTAAKQRLARRMGEDYAEIMGVQPDIITVSIHDLGAGGVWRCQKGDPVPAALVMCDVRQGRSAKTRATLARRLIDICIDDLGLAPNFVKVEFTQHSADEMYHPHLGGFNHEWTGDETGPNSKQYDHPSRDQ